MTTFHLDIITPARNAFSQDVDAVSVPTEQGTIEVLAGHVRLFSALTEGEIKVVSGTKEYFLSIGSGFMEVTGNHVSILVSSAYHAHELNEAEIKKAQIAAREALKSKVKGEELLAAQSLLRRSFVDLKVLRRGKNRSFDATVARSLSSS